MYNKHESSLPALPACAVTIAGSDSAGGAGIQADLKTFTRWQVFGASVLTAVTAQNTLGVTGVQALDPELITAQLDAVLADLPVSAAKTGMLANADIVAVVADGLERQQFPLVVDPVMVATSGARLLDREAEQAVVERLLPIATLVTPNQPEAAVLTGLETQSPPERLAEALLKLGCQAALVTGGHGDGSRVVDILADASGVRRIEHPRLAHRIHGTGCTLSAAITAALARGLPLAEAIKAAEDWLARLLAHLKRPSTGPLALIPFESGPSPV